MSRASQSSRYRCILHAKPAASLPDDVRQMNLNFPSERNSNLIIGEIWENIDGQQLPIGLEFRVDLDAASLMDAIVGATSLADGVASFITMVAGVGMPIPQPMLCFGISDTTKEHDFMQFFDNIRFNNPSRKRLPPNQLLDAMTAFYSLKDSAVASRVARAVRWYRLGTGVPEPFERFNAYWIGLEALNGMLQEKLDVTDDKATCPECGHEWIATPTVSGIREFCKRHVEDGTNLYRRMHDLRINVMHSKEKLTVLLPDAVSLAPLSANVLLGAIDFLMGKEKPWLSHSELLTNANPLRVEIDGKIVAEHPAALSPDPHLEASHSVARIERTRDGKVTLTVNSKFTAVLGSGASFNLSGIGVAGEGKGELHVIKAAPEGGNTEVRDVKAGRSSTES